jgi:hypothetical protein
MKQKDKYVLKDVCLEYVHYEIWIGNHNMIKTVIYCCCNWKTPFRTYPQTIIC